MISKTVEKPDLSDPELIKLLQQKSKYNQDQRTFEVIDFGARSKVQTDTKVRSVGDFSRHSSSGSRILTFMFHLSKLLQPNQFIELGTGLGFTSAAIGLGYPEAQVHSIEGNPSLAKYTEENLDDLGISYQLSIDKIENVLFTLNPASTWDMVFNDGNHTYEAAIEYFDFFAPKMSTKGIIIMDDIRWSEGMWQSWVELKNRPEVTASIDLFTLGVLCFNTDILDKQDIAIIPTIYKPWKKLIL